MPMRASPGKAATAAPAAEPAVYEERSLADLWQRRVPVISESGRFDPNRDSGAFAPESPIHQEVSRDAFFVGPTDLGIALGVLTSVMDGAIANVALPTIAADLGATPAASVWVVNAYQLAVCVALLPVAAIGEIVGYRRVFAVGFTVFTIASLCCALSPTLLTLSLSRALQGMGGATMMALSPPLVRLI